MKSPGRDFSRQTLKDFEYMSDGIMVSVVVPACNESQIIEGTIERIIRLLEGQKHYEWELIIVDDGSLDGTLRIAEAAAEGHEQVRVLSHERNYGLGRAIRTGLANARGEIIVVLDADLSYGPDYITRLSDALIAASADIAIASPYARGGAVKNVPLFRHLLSRWGNRLLALLHGWGIATFTSMVRAYRSSRICELELESDGIAFQLEVLRKAREKGLRFCEVPAVLEWSHGRRRSKMTILRTAASYIRYLSGGRQRKDWSDTPLL